MNDWNIKVNSRSQVIAERLTAAFGSGESFVFNLSHDEAGPVRFSLRKRVLYPDQILHRNRIIVSGTVASKESQNESDIKISFAQHFATTVTTYMLLGAGLFALYLALGSSATAYIPGALLIVFGIIFWSALREKFGRDIKKYKALLSEVVEYSED